MPILQNLAIFLRFLSYSSGRSLIRVNKGKYFPFIPEVGSEYSTSKFNSHAIVHLPLSITGSLV